MNFGNILKSDYELLLAFGPPSSARNYHCVETFMKRNTVSLCLIFGAVGFESYKKMNG